MKKIGRTETGNSLVEMTAHEEEEFARLGEAVEGRGFDGGFFAEPSRGYNEVNFDTVFKVIRIWYIAKFKTNELREILDDLEYSIGLKNEQT